MRLLISTTAALCLTVVLLTAACNPQDATAPPTQQQQAAKNSNVPTGATPLPSTPPLLPATPPGPQSANPEDAIRRVTVQELKAALDKGEALVLDVRNEESYQAGHIKPSKLMLESDIDKRFQELPKDKLIVTYCS